MTQPNVADAEAGRERLSPIVTNDTAEWLRIETARRRPDGSRPSQGEIIDALVAAERERRERESAARIACGVDPERAA
jgi:hypothetical protein